MRVVLIGPFAFYPLGTVPVRILPLAKVLRQSGHQVAILLPPYDNEKYSGSSFEVEGVEVKNVSIPRTRLPIKYLIVAGSLVKTALDFRPDVVHVFKPKGFSGLAGIFLVVLKFLKLAKVPIVVDSDDWEGYGGFADFYLEHGVYPKTMTDFFDFQEKWLIKRADAVTVASRTLQARAFGWRKDLDDAGVFYVPNGPSELPSSVGNSVVAVKKSLGLEGHRVVLLYTRFFEYDVEEVLDVITRVVSKLKDVRLLVVGKGEFGEEQSFLKLAQDKRLLDYIVYLGWVKPSEVRSFIEVGDVAIYPFNDTLLNRAKCPGKVVQLMFLGKAIVADDVGQISEYIENSKSGILVKTGKTEEFAGKVVEVLENERLREALGNEARRRINSSFNWALLAKSVQQAYDFVTMET